MNSNEEDNGHYYHKLTSSKKSTPLNGFAMANSFSISFPHIDVITFLVAFCMASHTFFFVPTCKRVILLHLCDASLVVNSSSHYIKNMKCMSHKCLRSKNVNTRLSNKNYAQLIKGTLWRPPTWKYKVSLCPF